MVYICNGLQVFTIYFKVVGIGFAHQRKSRVITLLEANKSISFLLFMHEFHSLQNAAKMTYLHYKCAHLAERCYTMFIYTCVFLGFLVKKRMTRG